MRQLFFHFKWRTNYDDGTYDIPGRGNFKIRFCGKLPVSHFVWMGMKDMPIGLNSIVARLSYGCDLLFRVIEVREDDTAVLYGEDLRLIADAPISDLVAVSREDRLELTRSFRVMEEQSFQLFRQDLELLKAQQEYKATRQYSRESNTFQIPGRVLHLDGDQLYLEKCLKVYKEIGLPVYGVHCPEKEMPVRIVDYINQYRPDILVITGHDAYSKGKGSKSNLNAYRNSKFFVEAVKEARKKIANLDQLVIFAGACQSHFESLIRAGANFASSPFRVNIHALDPVYIVARIGFTPFTESVDVWQVLKNTLTGDKGLGGIETKGVLRTGMPFKSEVEE
ncbi:MAG TPA: sporulation peptidase YabG [Chondromyces sp.]|nr:sporulation peptidase YabG [Chondromyces sp.]